MFASELPRAARRPLHAHAQGLHEHLVAADSNDQRRALGAVKAVRRRRAASRRVGIGSRQGAQVVVNDRYWPDALARAILLGFLALTLWAGLKARRSSLTAVLKWTCSLFRWPATFGAPNPIRVSSASRKVATCEQVIVRASRSAISAANRRTHFSIDLTEVGLRGALALTHRSTSRVNGRSSGYSTGYWVIWRSGVTLPGSKSPGGWISAKGLDTPRVLVSMGNCFSLSPAGDA
jgi:hypothetical protein